MKAFKIYTLGCKVNQYDSGRLAGELIRAGLVLVNKNVDIAIINSCAVTKTAMVKSGRMIKLAKKENPKAKIVLTGCWPKVYKIKNVDADFIVAEDKVGGVIKEITNCELRITNKIQNAMQEGRSRYFIKIQDGCEQFCSYCIIPYARGKLKSRGEPEVVSEIKQAVDIGYREIVLSGIHLGLYGKSRNPQRTTRNARNLSSLLKKLIKIDGLGRVRLSSIEITEVTDELIKVMAKANKICKHFHIPLQSGSNKILKLMNRPYDLKYFAERIKQIRKIIPDIAISTDVIVGFPGETEKDFLNTKNFIKQMKFSRLHVFPYSAHGKTPASKFNGQMEEKIKACRVKILRSLGVRLIEDYKKKFKGLELEVVVEQIKQDKIIGKSEFYFDVGLKKRQILGEKFSENKKLIGRIVKISN